MSTHTRYPFSAHVPFPDGTTHDFDRWGDSATFAIVGRDKVGKRNGEPFTVAQMCNGTREFTELAAKRDWLDRFGGEWSVVPVTHTSPGNLYR